MSKIIKYYRHAETKWNLEGRLQGWLDSALSENGIKQAEKIIWKPDIVYCSDLNRAYETAKLMFPNSKIVKNSNLREIYLGHWQGCQISTLLKDEQYMCYVDTPHLFRSTTQESFQQVTKRMLDFHISIGELAYEKIAVVSHGVALACLMTELNHQNYENLWNHLLKGTECVTMELQYS